MDAFTKFWQDHWKIIMIGLVGVALGVYLNYYLRDKENKKLLLSLISELTILQAKSNPTVDEKNQIEYLNGEIYILKFKCQ